MAILLKEKVIFLHIPKTAGSWIVSLLRDLDLYETEVGPAHADYERVFNFSGHYVGNYLRKSIRYNCFFDSHLKNCRSFAFVRNPVSYYESWWRFMEDQNWRKFSRDQNASRFGLKADLWHPYKQMESWGRVSFDEFVERVISDCPGFVSSLYEKYIPFGTHVVVGKQENLVSDFKKIISLFYGETFAAGIPSKPAVNRSRTPSPRWDCNLRKEVIRTEYSAFRRFNYDIPDVFV